MNPDGVLASAREAVRLADADPARAETVAALALRAARRAGHPIAASLAERAWGHAVLQCGGDLDAAIGHYRRSIRYGTRAGSAGLTAEARSKLAYALVLRGRPRAALAEVELALRDLDGPAAGRARAQRAVILTEAGRLDEALAEYRAALPVLRAAGDELAVARLLVNRGILHTHRHAFRAAVRDLRAAARLSRRLGRGLAVGIVAENLGYVETLRGDVPAALAHLEQAEQTITMHGGNVAPVYQDRAELLLSVGLVDESRDAAERAVLAYRAERRDLKVPEVRLLLAQAASLAGDPSVVVDQATRAAHEFGRQHRPSWAALARLVALLTKYKQGVNIPVRQLRPTVRALLAAGWPGAAVEAQLLAGRVEMARGRQVAAQPLLRAASRLGRRAGPATLQARGWFAEALLRASGSTPDRGATSAVRAGLRALDGHAAALPAADLRAHSAVYRQDLAELGLRLAMRDGRPARVFEWAERGRAIGLRLRSARPPHDERLAGLLAQLRSVAYDIGHHDGAVPTALLRRQRALEREVRDASRRRATLPGHASGSTDPIPVAALARALDRAALVEYLQLDGDLHALCLLEGRLTLATLGPIARLDALLERVPFALRRLAEASARGEAPDAVAALLTHTAQRLDSALLGGLPELRDRPLVVVPTGALHAVPWSILPSCRGRSVTVTPSATLWAGESPRESARPAPPALPHAAPVRVLVVAGPGLPGARDEAIAVAAVHRSAVLCDEAASVDAVVAGLDGAGVAHLAAHGRLSASNPLFSGLLLADGPFMAYDLDRLASVPDTVVLSACDSGRSVVRAGDELLGLAAAFLARGAGQLIGPIVPVPDAQTAPLMVALHRRLVTGATPPAALAQAQSELASSGDPGALAAAAGFICVGRRAQSAG